MPPTDPIEALGLGLAADHAAEKTKRTPKAKAAKAGEEAKAEALDAGSTAEEAEALEAVVEEKVDEATVNETPVAPGDDPASVFERRLDRLTTLVEEAQFESGTAFGDLRDCILDLFKHRPALWSAMGQSDQRDLIRHVEATAKQVLSKIVLAVAEDESETIQATLLGQFTVKGEAIEAKLKIEQANSDVLLDLYAMAGHRVVIVSADDKRFMSARRDAPTEPDQREIAFADPAPTPPSHPADDSDLADGADDADGDDGAETTDRDTWGVFDTDRGEWLIDEGGGESGWADMPSDAGLWSYERATQLAADFADGGDGVKARQLERTDAGTTIVND